MLTPDDLRALVEHQGGVCWICGKKGTAFRRLAIDHDHRTGEIRGLLCDYCNTTLGYLKDDVQWLAQAAAYLECPPTRQCWGVDHPRWWPNSPGAAGFDLREK